MELDKEDLLIELNSWSRIELIDWLCWNDKNGIYRDDESLSEIDNVLGKLESIEIMRR